MLLKLEQLDLQPAELGQVVAVELLFEDLVEPLFG